VFLFGNLLAYWLAGRALRPLRKVVDGLRDMERGAYHTRLPDLPGREAQVMSHAFNAMAQAVEDSVAAKKVAAEATEKLAENRELTQIIQARIEEERGAIARELHDELGQSVTAIKSVGLSIVQRAAGKDPDIEHAARLVVETAGQIYDVVHHMIPRLRPLALDRFGLADALGDLLGDDVAREDEPGSDAVRRARVEVANHGDRAVLDVDDLAVRDVDQDRAAEVPDRDRGPGGRPEDERRRVERDGPDGAALGGNVERGVDRRVLRPEAPAR
jgi:HAMP domain-containing protein